jgi:hypothetical protein
MHLGRAWKGATLISWSYTGIAGYPEDFDAHVVLNHEAVIRAIRKIANVKVGIKEGEPYSNTLYLSKSVIQECRTWIFKGPNECDFDAGMADEVMQVAAFGIVTYG